MIVTKLFSYGASRYSPDGKGDLIQIDKDLGNIVSCLQGRVRFGPGTSGHNGENIAGQFLSITTNATPNAESTFTHTMGSIPVGYIIIGQDKAGNLYQLATTGTAWTGSKIYLKCSVASVVFNLFLLK